MSRIILKLVFRFLGDLYAYDMYFNNRETKWEEIENTSITGSRSDRRITIITSKFNSNNGGRERSLQERRQPGYSYEDSGNPNLQLTEQTQAGSAHYFGQGKRSPLPSTAGNPIATVLQ